MYSVGLIIRVTSRVDFGLLPFSVSLIYVKFFLDILSQIIELGLGYQFQVIVEGQTCSCCCLFSYYACLLHYRPAFDRRIAYNDFRNNPYLHFDAGSVPRAFEV